MIVLIIFLFLSPQKVSKDFDSDPPLNLDSKIFGDLSGVPLHCKYELRTDSGDSGSGSHHPPVSFISPRLSLMTLFCSGFFLHLGPPPIAVELAQYKERSEKAVTTSILGPITGNGRSDLKRRWDCT